MFIVGYNPATSSDHDFWADWGETGFNKASWMEAYLAERVERPLAPGKKYRPKLSPSRRVIDQVVRSAGIPILETNIFARPSTDMASLDERDITPFNYLIDTLRPELVITHGKEAAQAATDLKLPSQIMPVPHFSRGWSRSAAEALGGRIRSAMLPPQS